MAGWGFAPGSSFSFETVAWLPVHPVLIFCLGNFDAIYKTTSELATPTYAMSPF
jgi:hypothetical protein